MGFTPMTSHLCAIAYKWDLQIEMLFERSVVVDIRSFDISDIRVDFVISGEQRYFLSAWIRTDKDTALQNAKAKSLEATGKLVSFLNERLTI